MKITRSFQDPALVAFKVSSFQGNTGRRRMRQGPANNEAVTTNPVQADTLRQCH